MTSIRSDLESLTDLIKLVNDRAKPGTPIGRKLTRVVFQDPRKPVEPKPLGSRK